MSAFLLAHFFNGYTGLLYLSKRPFSHRGIKSACSKTKLALKNVIAIPLIIL